MSGLDRHSVARLRWHAALTAVLFVVGSWIGLVHEATTNHVRCAEHGELIHGVAAADRTVATQATNPTVRDLAPIQPRELEHDHCLLTASAHSVSIASRVAPVTTTLAATPTAAYVPLYVVARADLFRTAPKTSPPV